MMALNDREKLFADEYIKLGNAYQAALNAGYAKTTADGASKWLSPDENPKKPGKKAKYKPEVREYIDARMAEKESDLIAKQDEVLKYLTAVMRGETESSTVVIEATLDGTTAAREMLKHPAESERLKAAELLGKRYGLYTDKVDVSGDVGVVIVDDIEDAESS